MRKFTIRLSTFFLIILLTTTMGINGYSYNQTDAKENFESLLPAILAAKDQFGISEDDINSLYIGSALSAYEEIGDSIRPINAEMYPVFSGAQVIGILTKETNVNGEIYFTYGIDFAPELDTYISQYGNQVSIIYRGLDVYAASDGKSAVLLKKLSDESLNSIFSDEMSFDNIVYSNIAPTDEVNIPASSRAAETKTLSIPYVSQRGPTCWAACIASIVNYKKGTDLEAYEVVVACQPNDAAGGASVNQIASYLTNQYGLSSYASNGEIQYDNVYWQINADKPMIISGYRNGNTGDGRHVVAVYGYYKDLSSLNESFYYMEPNTGFKIANFPKSGAPQFQISATQTYSQDCYVALR